MATCLNVSPATSSLRVNRLYNIVVLHRFRHYNRGPLTLINNTANVVNSPSNGSRRHGLLARRALHRGITYVGGRLTGFLSFRDSTPGGTRLIGGCS